jgi:hypothetical protein
MIRTGERRNRRGLWGSVFLLKEGKKKKARQRKREREEKTM